MKVLMKTEAANLHLTFKETVNFLDRIAREVREGKNVMLASQFARWLRFSGLIKIFADNPSAVPYLEVDASIVSTKVEDLIFECGELFRSGKIDPKYAASDIAEINRKLDLLLKESPGVGRRYPERREETSKPGRLIPLIPNTACERAFDTK